MPRVVDFDDVLDVAYEGAHAMSIEAEWETPAGWSFSGPEGPLPKLHVRITQLDTCEGV